MQVNEIRKFGRFADALEIPPLTEIQRGSYERFLQADIIPDKRDAIGLEALLREIFPIVSYDENMRLEFMDYELGKPRYSTDECRQLRLTYGMPFRIRLRLSYKDKPDVMEDNVYLGEMPIMIGGGEFIINGAERVIVNQLHRSPGVDFVIDSQEGDRPLHACRIIPERGSWIEINVTKKDVMVVRIDQSSKMSVTTFLRALDPKYTTSEAILREFYPTKQVPVDSLKADMYTVGPIIDKETGEELVKAGCQIGEALNKIQQSDIKKVEVLVKVTDMIILNSLAEDPAEDHESAMLRIYARLRPGNPAQIDKAKALFKEKFYDENRYRLGRVGRFRLNRKFEQEISESVMTLRPEDFLNSLKYLVNLRSGQGHVDDIDHLGNRRLRTIDELAADELRKGFLKLRRSVQERMSIKDPAQLGRIAELINSKSITSSIDFFFGRGELSQVVDQTNPLSQLTHERRLSALGPGGLNRKRAGFEVRDVHISHYGRICPIETPEGTNIGLIASLSIFSGVDEYGFLVTPYRKVENVKSTKTETKSDIKHNPEAEASISKWMKENLECLSFDLKLTDEEISEYVKYLEENLKPKEESKSKIEKLLGFIEDRVMIEFPDQENKNITPFFNRDFPKNSPDEIRQSWKKIKGSLLDYIKEVFDSLKDKGKAWDCDNKQVNNGAGLYVFRFSKQQGKIAYIGMAGKNLHERLGLHWNNNVEGSLFRWHIWKDKISKNINTDKRVGEVVTLRADEEMEAVLSPTDVLADDNEHLIKGAVLARVNGDLAQVDSGEIQYIDISSKQTVGVSAALIPFLEHDDANRALMGSNMQRQAVPLLVTEPPVVGTGMEKVVAQNSSMAIRARKAGTVTFVDALRIVIDEADEYVLRKFVGLNERTCLNQHPIVKLGEKVKKDQIIADGAATSQGELALGRNVLVGFMMFDGYNFEDAILISERLVKNDAFTSIHIEEFEIEIRETKLGREEFTRDIPNVSEKALANLDEGGVVRTGTFVKPGDILVGKVSPKSKSELSPEEKLLYAIFGRAGEDVKNDSLEVPSGEEGIVIDTKRFSRRMYMTDDQKKLQTKAQKDYQKLMSRKIADVFRLLAQALSDKLELQPVDPATRQKVGISENDDVILEQVETFDAAWIKPAAKREQAEKLIEPYMNRISELKEEMQRKLQQMKRGDELPSGVLEMVKIYIATKRHLSVGDKMAGRHGNKGVIARILPEEDMPFLEDGTPLDVLLNPLGVPSRMNVGQILETHLGWAAQILGFQALTPVFDGANEDDVHQAVKQANEHVHSRVKEFQEKNIAPPVEEIMVEMPFGGKVQLYDGRTGEPLQQTVTVGSIYLMKLHHLVDDKIHARATGPYSLITQQPLGGKARTGGQRFGEMEVWGLEAYGTAHILQELLTVKSDDVEGRTKIYESMVKGNNILEAGTPVSFDVLCNEIRGLGLNIQLEKKRVI